MYKLSNMDKMLYSALAVLLAFFSYLLYDDSMLFPSEDESNRKQIGTFSTSINDVRKKNIDSFSWIPASQKDSVFENDSVFTGDGSNAKISLNEGGELNISENSLVNLSFSNGGMQLDLKYGQFVGEIAEGTSLKIKNGKEELILKADTTKERSIIKLTKENSGNLNLNVLQGKAKIKSNNNTEKDLTKNESLTIDKNKIAHNEKIEIQILEESPITIYSSNEESQSTISWNSIGNIKQFKVEISNSRDFKTILKQDYTQNKTYSSNLKNGTYFYRVAAISELGKATFSNILQTDVVSVETPEILSPKDNAKLTFEKSPENMNSANTILIKWNSFDHFEKYELGISSNPDFIDEKIIVSSNEFLKVDLLKGTYWIRLKSYLKNNQNYLVSKSIQFKIVDQLDKKSRIAATEIDKKIIDFQIPEDLNSKFPTISWKEVSYASKYRLELSSSASFSNKIQFDVKSTNFKVNKYNVGKTYFRIFAVSSENVLGYSSQVGVLNVTSIPPQLKKNEVSEKRSPSSKLQEIDLNWNNLPLVSNYEVWIDKEKDFKNPIKIFSQTHSLKASPPLKGKFYSKVRAISSENFPVSDFSNVEEGTLSNGEQIKKPIAKEPFNKASIYLQNLNEVNIWLTWTSVPNADLGYTLEISNFPDFSKLIAKQRLKSNKYLFNEKSNEGIYYWRIKAHAVSSIDDSDWSAVSNFKIMKSDNQMFEVK